MRCGKYYKWGKNKGISWNGSGPNTLTTMVLIIVQVLTTSGIIVIPNTTTMTRIPI